MTRERRQRDLAWAEQIAYLDSSTAEAFPITETTYITGDSSGDLARLDAASKRRDAQVLYAACAVLWRRRKKDSVVLRALIKSMIRAGDKLHEEASRVPGQGRVSQGQAEAR